MVNVGIAITWIAISAASAKGLMAFANATAISQAKAELACQTGDELLAYGGQVYDNQAYDLNRSPKLINLTPDLGSYSSDSGAMFVGQLDRPAKRVPAGTGISIGATRRIKASAS